MIDYWPRAKKAEAALSASEMERERLVSVTHEYCADVEQLRAVCRYLRTEVEGLDTMLKDCRAIEVMLDGMWYARTDEDSHD